VNTTTLNYWLCTFKYIIE